MKNVSYILVGALIAGCSGIHVERTAQLRFDSLYFAKVEDRREITLEANESRAERVLVGLVAAGPVGAIATAQTEEGFSYPKAFEYTLTVNEAETRLVVTRSIVAVGSCVEVISPDETDIELLRLVPPENCKVEHSKAPLQTGG